MPCQVERVELERHALGQRRIRRPCPRGRESAVVFVTWTPAVRWWRPSVAATGDGAYGMDSATGRDRRAERSTTAVRRWTTRSPTPANPTRRPPTCRTRWCRAHPRHCDRGDERPSPSGSSSYLAGPEHAPCSNDSTHCESHGRAPIRAARPVGPTRSRLLRHGGGGRRKRSAHSPGITLAAGSIGFAPWLETSSRSNSVSPTATS